MLHTVSALEVCAQIRCQGSVKRIIWQHLDTSHKLIITMGLWHSQERATLSWKRQLLSPKDISILLSPDLSHLIKCFFVCLFCFYIQPYAHRQQKCHRCSPVELDRIEMFFFFPPRHRKFTVPHHIPCSRQYQQPCWSSALALFLFYSLL